MLDEKKQEADAHYEELKQAVDSSWANFTDRFSNHSAIDIARMENSIDIAIEFFEALLALTRYRFGRSLASDLIMHDLSNIFSSISININKLHEKKKPDLRTLGSLEEEIRDTLRYVPFLFEVTQLSDLHDFSLSALFSTLGISELVVQGSEFTKVKFKFSQPISVVIVAIHELIRNARKHSNIKNRMEFTVSIAEGVVVVSCKDFGKGIHIKGLESIRASLSEEIPTEVEANSGFGLKAMKYFGIGVQIDSEGKGKGTTVSLEIPVSAGEA